MLFENRKKKKVFKFLENLPYIFYIGMVYLFGAQLKIYIIQLLGHCLSHAPNWFLSPLALQETGLGHHIPCGDKVTE